MLITPEAEALFNEALTLDPSEREAFLSRACANNPLLFDEVSSLLTAANESESYFSALSGKVSLSALARGEDSESNGKVLGQWRLLSLIGRGGMGSVYLAERADGQFKKNVALKTLPIGLDSDAAFARFLNERQILAKLVHDNIARLLDGGVSDDGTPYFVMDYVEGTRIDHYCNTHDYSVEQCVDLILETSRGVQYAHRNLIIHRDLKPSNILVDGRGHPRLLDFGIAKMLESEGEQEVTRLALRPVTPAYASPEMLRGESVDVTTDVYSLGAVLYQMLTGHLPLDVEGKGIAELHQHVIQVEPAAASQYNPRIDNDLDAILGKALAKSPAERYASVESLMQDLTRWRDGLPVNAKAPSAFYRATKFVKRNSLGVALSTLAVFSLSGFAAFATYSASRSEQQAQVITEERDRAEAVKSFLVSIFEAASPQSSGDSVTAAQILDAGYERIQTEFDEQPKLRIDMLRTIANVYAAMGKTERMRDLLYESRELVKAHDGEQSVTYFDLLMSLAEAEDMMGNYAEAEEMSHELINIGKAIGDGASEGDARGRLGRMLHLKGDYAGADREYRESLRLLRASLGDENLRTAQSKLHLATLLDHTQKYQESYRLLLEVEATQKRLIKDENVVETDLYLGIARVLANLGRFDESLEIYQQTIDANTRLFGPDYQFNLYLFNGMGKVAEMKGDYNKAIDYQKKTLRLINMHTPDSPNVGRALLNQGRNYQLSQRCALAVPLFRQALSIFAEKLPEHMVNGEAKWRLAVCLAQFGEVNEAEALFVEANALLASSLAPDHKDVLDAREAAAAFFDQTGRPEKAKEYR